MRSRPWCGVLVALALSACGGDSPPNQKAESPAPPPRATAPPSSTLPVRIVSVSPETIDVRGGRVVPTTFTVVYEIANPEKISEAELRIQSAGLGVLQRQPVPVQASAAVTIAVDPIQDFGPHVRFRVVCAGAATEWRTLGEPPATAGPDASPGPSLKTVSPTEIRPSYTGETGGGERVGLHGSGFTPDCAVEGERDGSPIQLVNLAFQNGSFRGLLLRRDIDERPVARRYLDFGVSIRGPGIGQINLKRVLFNE